MDGVYLFVFAHTCKWSWKSTSKGRDASEPSLAGTGCAHRWPSGEANRRGGLRGLLPTFGISVLTMTCLGGSEFVSHGRTYTSRRKLVAMNIA